LTKPSPVPSPKPRSAEISEPKPVPPPKLDNEITTPAPKDDRPVEKLTLSDDISFNFMAELCPKPKLLTKARVTDLPNPLTNFDSSPATSSPSSSSSSPHPGSGEEKRERITLKIRTKDLIPPKDSSPYSKPKNKKKKSKKSDEIDFENSVYVREARAEQERLERQRDHLEKQRERLELQRAEHKKRTELELVEQKKRAEQKHLAEQKMKMESEKLRLGQHVVQRAEIQTQQVQQQKNAQNQARSKQMDRVSKQLQLLTEKGIKISSFGSILKSPAKPTTTPKPEAPKPIVVLDSGSQKPQQRKAIPVITDPKNAKYQHATCNKESKGDTKDSIRSALKAKINQRRFVEPFMGAIEPYEAREPEKSFKIETNCVVSKYNGECLCGNAAMVMCGVCQFLSHGGCSEGVCGHCGALLRC